MKIILLLALVSLCVTAGLAGGAGGELALDKAVSRAVAANPMLKAARAKWAALKERVPQAKAWEIR